MKNWGFRKIGDNAEKWPKDENGKPVEPAFLQHLSGSQLDVEMGINLLGAYNIPVMTVYPNDGEFGKLILGFAGTGVDVYVPENMLEEAKSIIAAEAEDTEEAD